MKRLLLTAAVLAATGFAGSVAAQERGPLSIDDSLICAGLFFAQSQLPENAGYPEGVENYRTITGVFLDRAEILAGREGASTDWHTERAAQTAAFLIGEVDAAADARARYAVIASWQGAEDECMAGGRVPV